MPAQATQSIPREELAALLKVSIALASSLELDVVLQTAIENAVEVFDLGTGSIYLLDGDELRLGATTPAFSPDVPSALAILRVADHPHIEEALSTGQPTFIADTTSSELSATERVAVDLRGLRSVLFVPLLARGRAEGMMVLGSSDGKRDYSEADLDLCRALSAQVALALANAQLFESAQQAAADLRAAYDATLSGWSLALELRDEETSGHTERAAHLAVELARRLGVPEVDLGHVWRGALLHD